MQNLIMRFQDETGERFDRNGPDVKACDCCGRLMQYYFDPETGTGHTCPETKAAIAAAKREEF